MKTQATDVYVGLLGVPWGEHDAPLLLQLPVAHWVSLQSGGNLFMSDSFILKRG